MTVLQQLLQPLWEISSEPVVITGNEVDPDDRCILYVNQAFTRLTGYSGEQAIGRPPSILHGRETNLDTVRSSEDQLRTGRSQEYKLLLYNRNGSSHQCVITRAPLVDLDGVSEYLITMYRVAAESDSTAAADNLPLKEWVPLTLPMPLREFPDGQLPRHLKSHPELDALMALWRELRSKGTLPSRRDFTLNVMTRWASHLSIAVVNAEERFQFRLFGTELANVYGRDLTNCFLDELTPRDLWAVVIEHYRDAIRTGEPLFAPISVSNGRWYTEVSRLLLPLSGDGQVNLVMAADYRREL